MRFHNNALSTYLLIKLVKSMVAPSAILYTTELFPTLNVTFKAPKSIVLGVDGLEVC